MRSRVENFQLGEATERKKPTIEMIFKPLSFIDMGVSSLKVNNLYFKGAFTLEKAPLQVGMLL